MAQIREDTLSTTFPSGVSACWACQMAQIRDHTPTTTFPVYQLVRLVKWYRVEITHILQHFRVVYQLVGLIKWHRAEVTHFLQHFRVVYQHVGLAEWYRDRHTPTTTFPSCASVCWFKCYTWSLTHILQHHQGFVNHDSGLIECIPTTLSIVSHTGSIITPLWRCLPEASSLYILLSIQMWGLHLPTVIKFQSFSCCENESRIQTTRTVSISVNSLTSEHTS